MIGGCRETRPEPNGFRVFMHHQHPNSQWRAPNALSAQRRLLHQTKVSILVLIEAALDPLYVQHWLVQVKESTTPQAEVQSGIPCCPEPERFT